MDFSKYLTSWKTDFVAKVNDLLQQYGNVDEMTSYINGMIPFYKDNITELAVTKEFFCFCQTNHQFIICETKHIESFYYSEIKGSSALCEVGLIFDNGRVLSFIASNDKLMTIIQILNQYFCCIDSHIPCFREYESSTLSFHKASLEPRITVNSKELIKWREKINLFRKSAVSEKKVILKIEDISNVIWVKQIWEDDCGDTPAYANLKVYVADGMVHTFSFFGGDKGKAQKAAFELALHIKDNVPHLLYGPNEAYDNLFRENPLKLMELAKEKCNK